MRIKVRHVRIKVRHMRICCLIFFGDFATAFCHFVGDFATAFCHFVGDFATAFCDCKSPTTFTTMAGLCEYFRVDGLVSNTEFNGTTVQCASGEVSSCTSGRVKAIFFNEKRFWVKLENLRPADASVIAHLCNCLLTCQLLVLKLSGCILFKVNPILSVKIQLALPPKKKQIGPMIEIMPKVYQYVAKIRLELDSMLAMLPNPYRAPMQEFFKETIVTALDGIASGQIQMVERKSFNGFFTRQRIALNLLSEFNDALVKRGHFATIWRVRRNILFRKTKRHVERNPNIMLFFRDQGLINADQYAQSMLDSNLAAAILLGSGPENMEQDIVSLQVPCMSCGRSSSKKCPCTMVMYCSKECQVAHWPTHKTSCTFKN
jgi:hypothetical protein